MNTLIAYWQCSCSRTCHSTYSQEGIWRVSHVCREPLSPPDMVSFFFVRAVPGLPTLSRLFTAFMCGVRTRDPAVGSMHDFASTPFLKRTSPRAPRPGLRNRLLVDYMFQALFF